MNIPITEYNIQCENNAIDFNIVIKNYVSPTRYDKPLLISSNDIAYLENSLKGKIGE